MRTRFPLRLVAALLAAAISLPCQDAGDPGDRSARQPRVTQAKDAAAAQQGSSQAALRRELRRLLAEVDGQELSDADKQLVRKAVLQAANSLFSRDKEVPVAAVVEQLAPGAYMVRDVAKKSVDAAPRPQSPAQSDLNAMQQEVAVLRQQLDLESLRRNLENSRHAAAVEREERQRKPDRAAAELSALETQAKILAKQLEIEKLRSAIEHARRDRSALSGEAQQGGGRDASGPQGPTTGGPSGPTKRGSGREE